MIVQKEIRNIRSSGDFEKIEMGIQAKNMAHILKLLSNPYSRPIEAVIREYSTNALDEHVKWGVEQTFKVSLPSVFEPTLKIRDFAKGLTKQQVKDIYAQYGESTKRDEADEMANLYNGQIGIGAKSGLCYGTKSFTITSYVGGEMSVYRCYIDENERPTYAHLFSAATEEPDGLEVSIPVEPSDIQSFITSATRVFTYFSIKPDITGTNATFERPQAQYDLKGTDWTFTGNNQSYIVMGNVAYPIDLTQINRQHGPEYILVQAGVEIDVPIGDVAMSISRESLEYTPRVKARVNEHLERVIKELAELVEEKFANATNIWEAKILYRKVFMEMGNIGQHLSKMLKGKVKWNGIELNGDLFKWEHSDDSVIITHFTKSYRKTSKLSTSRVRQIQAKDKNVVVINDLNTGKGSPSRIAQLYDTTQFGECYVLSFAGDAAEKKFMDELNFHTVPTLKLSELEKPEVLRLATGVNPKHQLKCFKWDGNKVTYGINSDAWQHESVDFENGKGVYVKIERFEALNPLNRQSHTPYYLKAMLDKVEALGIKLPEIYAFKPSVLEKNTLGSGWVNLWDWIKAELDKVVSKKGVSQDLIDHYEAQQHGTDQYNAIITTRLTEPNSLMRDYLEFYEKAKATNLPTGGNTLTVEGVMEAYKSFGFSYTANFKPTHSLKQMLSDIDAKYPLIPSSIYDIKGKLEAVIEYINLIDAKP